MSSEHVTIADEFSEDIDIIESILNKYESINVDYLDCMKGSNPGDNYMSVIKRVIVNGHFADTNKAYKKSFIVKRHFLNEARRKLFRCDEVFDNEITAYNYLVPVMKKFSKNRLPYPNCIYAGLDKHDQIIIMMEDLKKSGYNMANRRDGLNREQINLVMQELGNLHSISLAMKCIDPVSFYSTRIHMKEIVYYESAAKLYSPTVETALRASLSSLQYSNIDGSLDKPIECLKRMEGQIFEIMCQNILDNPEPWNVICHGDVWINNLMFKNDNSSVKFLDLQTLRYTNPVIDIIHVLHSSTWTNIRVNFLNEFLTHYHNSLMNSLQIYLLPDRRDDYERLREIFTLENIKAQYESHILYGICIVMWIMPAITFDPDNIPNLDEFTQDDYEPNAHEEKIYSKFTKAFHYRMKEAALEFYDNGYLHEFD